MLWKLFNGKMYTKREREREIKRKMCSTPILDDRVVRRLSLTQQQNITCYMSHICRLPKGWSAVFTALNTIRRLALHHKSAILNDIRSSPGTGAGCSGGTGSVNGNQSSIGSSFTLKGMKAGGIGGASGSGHHYAKQQSSGGSRGSKHKLLHSVVLGVLSSMSNLRSQIAKNALLALGDLFDPRGLGPSMEPEVDSVALALLKVRIYFGISS